MTLVSNTARSRSVTFPISVDGRPTRNDLATYSLASLAQLCRELVTRQGAQGHSAFAGCLADFGSRFRAPLLLKQRNDIQYDG